MDNEIQLSFNIRKIIMDENGNYIGLDTDVGFVIECKDKNGKNIPFNKEVIDEILGVSNHREDNQ